MRLTALNRGAQPREQHITELQDELMHLQNWTAFTPTVTQFVTVTTSTALSARYMLTGKTAVVQVYAPLTSAGSSTGTDAIVLATIPSAIAPKVQTIAGHAVYLDTGTAYHSLAAKFISATQVAFYESGAGAAFGSTGPTAANTDVLEVVLSYEVA